MQIQIKYLYLQSCSKNRSTNLGEVVEWSITAVLKTVELKGSGGSNPSLSANNLKLSAKRWAFFVQGRQELAPVRTCAEKDHRPSGRELQIVCGEGGIRTPGASQLNSFQDCRNRPLYHLSIPNWDCKFRKLFQICKIFL